MKHNIDIGFSPCPNDTFIFDALVNGKIDTGDFRFNPVIEDVETLNQWALEGKLDVSKISYGVLAEVMNDYMFLRSGSALGRGAGPLLIVNKELQNEFKADTLVAIPGKNTTAHVLFSLAYPEMNNKEFLRYDEVQKFVLEGRGAGVIIHENRFTYEALGLVMLRDLGETWEQKTGLPIPLGGIVAKKRLGDIGIAISRLIRKSLEYSWKQYPQLSTFITSHAMEMEEDVMRKHINLYVNEFSLDLGEEGVHAIKKFIDVRNPGPHVNFSPVQAT